MTVERTDDELLYNVLVTVCADWNKHVHKISGNEETDYRLIDSINEILKEGKSKYFIEEGSYGSVGVSLR